MTVALVSIAVALLVVAAVVASSRMRHPDNFETTGEHSTGGADDPADASDGSDLPGGPASEDPPTEVPNRLEVEPPPGPA